MDFILLPNITYIFFYSIEKEGTVSLKIRPKIEKFISFYILENMYMYVKSTGTCNMLCTFILFPEVNDEFNNMSYSLDLVKMMKKSSTKLIYLMWNCIVKLKFHFKRHKFLIKKNYWKWCLPKFYKKCRKITFFLWCRNYFYESLMLLFIDFLFLNMTLKQGKIWKTVPSIGIRFFFSYFFVFARV